MIIWVHNGFASTMASSMIDSCDSASDDIESKENEEVVAFFGPPRPRGTLPKEDDEDLDEEDPEMELRTLEDAKRYRNQLTDSDRHDRSDRAININEKDDYIDFKSTSELAIDAYNKFKDEEMTSESAFVQQAIPKFDGHYDHWCMLMENFLPSKEYWSIIEDGIPAAVEGTQLSEAQKRAIDDARLKDMKAKNYLFQAIDRSILETILNNETSKSIWDSLKQKYQGTA